MAAAPPDVDGRLHDIEDAIDALARRVARLEDRAAGAHPALPAAPLDLKAAPATAVPAPADAPASSLDVARLLSLAGRTLVVLGGAFFLRALTDAGRLPAPAGVALGLIYAAAWLAAADRAASTRPMSALFHGVAGLLVALPLLCEATLRFKVLGDATGALALGLTAVVALAVARRRALAVFAGVSSAGVVAAGGVIAAGTGAVLPDALLMVGLAAICWRVGDQRRWPWLRWLPALAADAMVLGLGVRAGIQPPPSDPALALTAALLLACLTIAFVAARLARDRGLAIFDAIQTLLAITIGMSAAFALAPSVGPGVASSVGAAVLVCAMASYTAAIAVMVRRPDALREFYYYSALGLVLLLMGLPGLLRDAARDVTTGALAIVCAWVGGRRVHTSFGVHAALLALAAAVGSGFALPAIRIWTDAPGSWPGLPLVIWMVLFTTAAGVLIPHDAGTRDLRLAGIVARLLLAIGLVASATTIVVRLAGAWIAGPALDSGRLASFKTIVLAATAVGLTELARRWRAPELRWLAYPVLALGALKLLIEDFRLSAPSTLFVALAAFGTALILTARRWKTQPPR